MNGAGENGQLEVKRSIGSWPTGGVIGNLVRIGYWM